MKKALLSLIPFFVLLAMVPQLRADFEPDSRRVVEVPLLKAYIPEYGFDDNDNVQVVIEGYLPNSCYTLAQSETDLSGSELKVTQKAIRNESGICSEEADLPPDLAAQRYFWKVLDVGLMDEGSYSLKYLNMDDSRINRPFYIQLSPSNQVDSMNYVYVTNAFAKESVHVSEEYFEFRITGQLTSTCAEMADDYYLEKSGDVYALMLYTYRVEDYCMPASRPFYKIIRVRTPEKGRYLLHVRSVGGQSKNKIFEVHDRND